MSDALDAKLARLGGRLQANADAIRAELARVGILDLAEALRTAFDARLVHLRTDRVDVGRDWRRPLEPEPVARKDWHYRLGRGN